MKLKLDLHDIYNHSGDIDRALRAIIDEAITKKAPLVGIVAASRFRSRDSRGADMTR